jgi:hypothetical protein
LRRNLAERLRSVRPRLRGAEAVNHFSRSDQAQFLSRDLFEVKIVVAKTVDAIPQAFVFLLQGKVSFIQPLLFFLQPPQVNCASIGENGKERKRDEEKDEAPDEKTELRYLERRHRFRIDSA